MYTFYSVGECFFPAICGLVGILGGFRYTKFGIIACVVAENPLTGNGRGYNCHTFHYAYMAAVIERHISDGLDIGTESEGFQGAGRIPEE